MKLFNIINSSLNKKFFFLILFGSLSFFILAYRFYQEPIKRTFLKTTEIYNDVVQCSREPSSFFQKSKEFFEKDVNTEQKVLVITDKLKDPFYKSIVMIIESLRLKYHSSSSVEHLVKFFHKKTDAYSVIIFDKLSSYTKLSFLDQNILKKYCKQFNVGIIVFCSDISNQNSLQALHGEKRNSIKNYNINYLSPLLRITKTGSLPLNSYITPYLNDLIFFSSNDSNYEPVTFTKPQFCTHNSCYHSPIIRDKGLLDGMEKVIFGTDLSFWLHIMLFVDAMCFQSKGVIRPSLERSVLVDIDDVFVAKSGTRFTKPDVQALVASQEKIRVHVENFTFNLGFSGFYFLKGNNHEDEGDWAILENKEKFWWFGHTYKHRQAHLFNTSQIIADMNLNKLFAQRHGIMVTNNYSVSPHHAGVFPVHEELYEAWRQVWGVQVTSTEQYPALWPARRRRGFVHKGIKVLPRQVCDLYTTNVWLDEYVGGTEKFLKNILGGNLFLSILFNPMTIFMTHQSNYAGDRLALITFENVFSFISCWTNFRLKTIPPLQMAEEYFRDHPTEVSPLWMNPCRSKRHKEIWASYKNCEQLPALVVLGPQKTGTTALHMFLSMHPSLKSSVLNNQTFEEVQFFNDKNYFKGIDWYMNQFPPPTSMASNNSYNEDGEVDIEDQGNMMLFEKSATYFADEKVPKRIFQLLPEAKLIIIIIDPSLRAYSWYQHMVAHEDPVALKYSFHQVITADLSAHPEVLRLQHRCLDPGKYAVHIKRWLRFFHRDQILILDGEVLKEDAVTLMHQTQQFLDLRPSINYRSIIRYNKKKGFYCIKKAGGKTHCLGSGKGRDYPPMHNDTRLFLSNYFRSSNQALESLLLKLNYPLPRWLSQELVLSSNF